MTFEYKLKHALISLSILLVGTFVIVSINASNVKALSINWIGIYSFLIPVLSFIFLFPLLLVRISKRNNTK
jgi:uncharacterized membrane protein AbrB (regulator of aidB expression)